MQITDGDCVPGCDEKTVNKIRKNVYWGRILKPLFYMLYACVKGTPWLGFTRPDTDSSV